MYLRKSDQDPFHAQITSTVSFLRSKAESSQKSVKKVMDLFIATSDLEYLGVNKKQMTRCLQWLHEKKIITFVDFTSKEENINRDVKNLFPVDSKLNFDLLSKQEIDEVTQEANDILESGVLVNAVFGILVPEYKKLEHIAESNSFLVHYSKYKN